MRIFVSGSEGQLAKSLTEQMSKQKDIVVVCAGRPDFDLLNPEKLEAAILKASPDIIVNAAAYTAVDWAEENPEIAFAINRDGAAAMAQAAVNINIPIIQISTDYVFSGNRIGSYVEDDATGPLNVYGRSKLEGEIAVRSIAAHHAILRTSWVYSPFGNNFVKTMMRLAKERETLNVVADQTGCPTSAIDLAQAIVAVSRGLIDNPILSGTFHAAGNGITNWASFAEEIFNVLSENGYRVPLVNKIDSVDYKTAAKRPVNSVLDCSKLKQTFDIQLPNFHGSLRDCIRRILEE